MTLARDAADLDLGEPDLHESDARVLLDRQTAVLELIAGTAPLGDVLDEILTSLERLMPGARCSVLRLDRDRGTLHHAAAPTLPASYVATIDGMAIGDGAGSCGTAAALNTAVVAADVGTDPRWTDFRHAARGVGLRSCWSTPIPGPDGLPVGTFAVYHGRAHRPTRREQWLVDRFTRLASVAIEHSDLVDDLVVSEERFRRSFDDNALGMAILGPDRTITTSNATLARLTRGRADLVGRALGDLLTPVGHDLETLLDDLDATAPVTFEARLHVPGAPAGHPGVEVELTVSLLCGRDGGPSQYVVNVLDLTERRAAERDRRGRLEADTARRTAEDLLRAKSEMLAAVGHEARTPIQAIVGFAELLGTLDLDEPRRREALGHIDAAAGHVMDLLTDVLDLSRVEAGALPLALEPVRVRDTVAEVRALVSAKAEHRGVRLLDDLADQVVRADRRRLRQVLLNLVDNAVRHGRAGGHVRVRSVSTPDDPHLLLTVDDDGPGIPPDLVPRIFTPFARGPVSADTDTDTDTTDSVGLGLGLAHGLMRAMGGDLTLRRSTPSGTSMLLRIPYADPAAPTSPAPPAHHERTTP